MRTHKMQVVTVDIEEIQQNPENANNGDIDGIWESIEVNGFYKPILVQESSGYILAGNHSYVAAIRARAKQVPVIYLDVDDEQAARIMVADNATNRRGHDDEAALADLLQGLLETDTGLAGTGYDGGDLERLLASTEEPLDFDGADVVDDRLSDTRKASAGVSLIPVVSEDGFVYELTVLKEGMGPISKADYQKMRKGLGLGSASKTEIAAYAVPEWR